MIELDKNKKIEILQKAQDWFRDVLAQNHIKNTIKLANPNEFKINPFLVTYLANFLTGNSSAKSIARALVYPRVLGSFGSTTAGIDIEFIDYTDQNKKYCQLKAGPNNLNKDDVITIKNHFRAIHNLARVNNLAIGVNDLIVGVMYGEPEQLSSHYKKIQNDHHYPVIVGKYFWLRLTGDENFYYELIKAFAEVANEADSTQLLEKTILELSQSDIIKNLSSD